MTPSALLSMPPMKDHVTMVSFKLPALEVVTPVQKDEPALLHRSLLERPHKVLKAAGSYLYLEDGRKILDGCGGAAVINIGHGNAEVMADTLAQMQKVSYVHTGFYTTDSAEDLAACILGNQRGGSFDSKLVRAYFVGSGSEANDAALKCAKQFWSEKGEMQRKYYVSRRQAYHGNTIGAMSVSSNLPRKVPYMDITLSNVSYVSPAYAYQYQTPFETEAEYVARLAKELDDEFQRLGPENVISFIAEPIVGATSGCVPAPKGYFAAIRAVCDKYNILLHLDEIMCGTGRTGTYFAFEQEDIIPDIVTIGKGLSGGYAPIAAMLINNRIVSTIRDGTSTFNHGHTYQAHPVSCATTLSVQKIIARDALVARCAALGSTLHALLRDALVHLPAVGDIRGRGLFWGVEFVQDRRTRAPFAPQLAFGGRVQRAAWETGGVALYPGAGTVDGVRGDHVLVMPPYTVSVAELKMIVTALKDAVVAVSMEVAVETGCAS